MIAKLDLLSGFAVRIFQAAPTLRSYFGLVDATEEVREAPDARPLEHVTGEVRYENVTFRFKDSDQGVFDIGFEAPAGTTTALVGPTGAGKTTTLALLQRLRSPHAGRILIDGQDIEEVTLNSLRHHIAVVFQDAGLFNRSIAENVRIGRPDASDAEVEEAARLAEAHDFIVQEARRLPVRDRRARSLAVGRRAPAHRHCPRHPEGRPDPHPRRGHERARRGDGEPHQARAGPAAAGPHHLHHRAPAVHGRRRRLHPGAGPRAHHRARHLPRAGGWAGPVRPPGGRGRLHGAGRGGQGGRGRARRMLTVPDARRSSPRYPQASLVTAPSAVPTGPPTLCRRRRRP